MTGESRAKGDGRLIAGRYRTVERLGRGGMGTVWRAVDETLGRQVAVKELRDFADEHDGHDADRLAGLRLRMQREARAAARIQHPGVVAVHDVTDHEGHPVIVMELIEGASLDDVMRRQGALDPRHAAEIGAKVLDALAAAHRAGVLHRDVKPANILLEHGGRVVLTDFGIAAIDDPGDDADTHLTRSGELVGSLDYLAPERARGEQPGPPSDVWSLGATLYAAVEGGTPFRRTSTWSTITAIVTEPLPEPRRAGPLTPVLHGLLAKDPASRPDAAQAAQLLSAIATGRPLPPASPDAPGTGAAQPDPAVTMRLGRSVPSAQTPETPEKPQTPEAPSAGPFGPFGPPPVLSRDAGPFRTQPHTADADEGAPAGPRSRRGRSLTIAAAALAVLLIGGGVTYLAVGAGSDDNDGKDAAAASAAERASAEGDDNTPSQQPGSARASKSGGKDGRDGKGDKEGNEAGDQGKAVADPAQSPAPSANSPDSSASSDETEAAPSASASEATGSGPTYRLVNAKSGKCLSLDNGGSAANGTSAIQWACNGGDEQRWYWAGPSSNMLKNVKTGKCLSIADHGSTANGARDLPLVA
ncbi:protein kinase [Streptomyces sp. DT2A-34]|uniref:serine/threonine protein kinase n=1 Tax=Streptomyces sp. DT2A-34 TaxID=3051182 RepID=UPI00265C4565|nr:protein kinase [Streptomyces sp. DT2A-34]MDO0912827.1 protein kinase [Streptomyces sp. DT2A-34]